ncbi:hypothetical protein ACYSNW_16325 [Enterococcus sp. LJL99]
MKKLSNEKASKIVGGVVYEGAGYGVGRYYYYCYHSCSRGRRQHNVQGNVVTHLCTAAP